MGEPHSTHAADENAYKTLVGKI